MRTHWRDTMRHSTLRLGLFLALIAAVAACDVAPSLRVAGLGGGGSTGGTGGNGGTNQLVITPNQAQVLVGATLPLTTNATTDQLTHLQWLSLQPNIATVTSTGIVTGVVPGSATIVARLVDDTLNFGTAIITVIGVSGTP